MIATRFGRRAMITAAGLLAAPSIVRAQQTTGVALVIGNSKYQWEASLPNVRRDAPDIAKRFQALGLKTELVEDAGHDALRRAVDNFAATARGANLAALYFAGHGASWAKETYLVPVDADLSTPDTVRTLIPVASVGAAMKEAAHRLVVFDNCRNNPADGWRQLEAERMAAVLREGQLGNAGQMPNTLVLFSTAPGRIALDGPPGQNSPFAAALLHQLGTEAADLQSLPAKLRRDLLIATQGRQVVWDENTYAQPFQLGGSRSTPAGTANVSGWSQDPAGIIELPKAYAFARENGLELPLGLISHRPPSTSGDSRKVGSFTYLAQTVGSPTPRVLVVLSVEEQQTAEVISASTGRNAWRFVDATISGDKLEFTAKDQGAHFTLTWHDANSGMVSQHKEGLGKGAKRQVFETQFTRLDG